MNSGKASPKLRPCSSRQAPLRQAQELLRLEQAPVQAAHQRGRIGQEMAQQVGRAQLRALAAAVLAQGAAAELLQIQRHQGLLRLGRGGALAGGLGGVEIEEEQHRRCQQAAQALLRGQGQAAPAQLYFQLGLAQRREGQRLKAAQGVLQHGGAALRDQQAQARAGAQLLQLRQELLAARPSLVQPVQQQHEPRPAAGTRAVEERLQRVQRILPAGAAGREAQQPQQAAPYVVRLAGTGLISPQGQENVHRLPRPEDRGAARGELQQQARLAHAAGACEQETPAPVEPPLQLRPRERLPFRRR